MAYGLLNEPSCRNSKHCSSCMRKFIRHVLWRWDYNPLGKAGLTDYLTLQRYPALVNLFYPLEYMNRWSALITLTLVLCDVAIQSPTLAQPRPFPHQWKETVLMGSNLSLSGTNCVTDRSKALMGIGLHLSFKPGQCKCEEALKGGGHLLRQYRYWSNVHHLRGVSSNPQHSHGPAPPPVRTLFSRRAAAQLWWPLHHGRQEKSLRASNPQKYNWNLRCTSEFSL